MDTHADSEIELQSQTASTGIHTSQTPAALIVQAASSRNTTPDCTPEALPRPAHKQASRSLLPQALPMKSTSDMQPPAAKRQRTHNYDRRPRLSICPSVSPDPDLVEDRDRNDNTLKGKFEAIFEKYGRDFSEIGDEINVMTGEVVVDHGHILSMVNEKDPGSPSRAKARVSREPTEVQNMTPMPRGERSFTVGALDVIASIEAMARRTVTGQTPYHDHQGNDADEPDDVYEYGEAFPYRSGSVSSDSLLGSVRDGYQDDWGRQRSGSPDSLLGYEEQDSSVDSFYDEHTLLPPLPPNASGSMEKPIVLTSGPISAPAPNPECFSGGRTSSDGAASLRSPSPPVFVKSNGQKKVVMKKINVSRAYEELQRQASTTPAITSSQLVASAAVTPKDNPTGPPTRLQPSSRTGETVGRLQEATSKPKAAVRTILKRLPIPRPSSEPLSADYESDDPLQ
jgi:hypothetical protein